MRIGHVVLHGDSSEILKTLPTGQVDAIVTDPPYELGFMGKAWDSSGVAYSTAMWAECLRVLKPGGHLLAFGGTRTYHRMTCAIEDAGFEIRDGMNWLYGSGFPKSLDVGKAIDKEAGAERKVVHAVTSGRSGSDDETQSGGRNYRHGDNRDVTAPATADAQRWDGWGTALKPAHEPIVVARKPLIGTVASNVLAHGTGALNIDATRVQMSDADRAFIHKTARPNSAGQTHFGDVMNRPAAPTVNVHDAGRWPANFLLSHDPACEEARPDVPYPAVCVEGCPVAELDAQSGTRTSGSRKAGTHDVLGYHGGSKGEMPAITGDSGGASRFFPVFRYCAKAPTRERPVGPDGTKHATVKPLTLMRWLVRLVTPPGGVVLDPFAGSGTTVEACTLEGFDCIAIERDATHLPLIQHRIERAYTKAARQSED